MVSSVIPPTSPLAKTVFVLVYGEITRLDCKWKTSVNIIQKIKMHDKESSKNKNTEQLYIL